MDRREFLTSTGLAAAASATTASGVAAAVAATGAPAGANSTVAAPAIGGRARHLIVSLAQSIDTLETGTAARRFAHRLETAFGEGTKVSVVTSLSSGHEAVTTAEIDLAIGLESHHATYNPAFRLLAGLPVGEHLTPFQQQAWLSVGGGQELWDALAAPFGVKSLAVGHTGIGAGLFSDRIIETADDFQGMRVACRGMARDVVKALGGEPVGVSEAELAGGLVGLGLDAAEPFGMPTRAIAHWSYQPGLMPGGMMLSLAMRSSFWANLGSSGQAIIEGAAAEAFGHSLAVATANEASIRQIQQFRRWPIPTGVPGAFGAALSGAGTAAVDAVAATSPESGRLVASLRAFRAGVADRPLGAVA